MKLTTFFLVDIYFVVIVLMYFGGLRIASAKNERQAIIAQVDAAEIEIDILYAKYGHMKAAVDSLEARMNRLTDSLNVAVATLSAAFNLTERRLGWQSESVAMLVGVKEQ